MGSARHINQQRLGRSPLRRDPTTTTSPSPHHRAVQQSTELARSGVIAPRAKQRPTRWCAKAYHGPPRVKPRKGAVRERQKGLVTREDRAAHDRGRAFEGERWKDWAPFTKGETKQGHSARTSKGLVTREDRAVHERGRTFGRHSPRVKPSKGAVRERQKGLVTREDRTAHERGRTFGEWY